MEIFDSTSPADYKAIAVAEDQAKTRMLKNVVLGRVTRNTLNETLRVCSKSYKVMAIIMAESL